MAGNIKLSVKGARLLDEPTLLQHMKLMDDELAPPVQLQQPAAAPPPAAPRQKELDAVWDDAPAPAPVAPAKPQEEEIAQAPASLEPPAPPPADVAAPEAASPDYSADLADAQKRSADNRLLAGTGAAAQHLIDTVSGTKGAGFFQNALKSADQPLEDLQQRMEVDKAAAAQQVKDDETNPGSRASAVAREQLRALNPRGASMLGPAFERMSAKDVANFMGVSLKDMQLDALLEKNRSTAEQGQQKLDLQEAEHQRKLDEFIKTLPIEQQKAAAAVLGAKASMLRAMTMPEQIAASAGRADAVHGRRQSDWLISYNKDTNKLQPLAAAMTEIDRMAPGLMSGKVPANVNFDVADNIIRQLPAGAGARFTPAEDTALRGMLEKLITDIRYGTAGANLMPHEREDYARIFQTGLASPPEAKAAMLNAFRRKLYNELSAKSAAYRQSIPPDMWQRFVQEGGYAPESPLFKDIHGGGAPRPAAPPAAPPAQAAAPPAKPPPAGKKRVRYPNDPSGKTYLIPINVNDGSIEVK